VLLLHGWTATAGLNWHTSFPKLASHFRVIALDHRGHGRGIRSRRPFHLEDCADDAAALVRALGADPVIAVGYSMGGPIAQLFWQRHRPLTAGLVLCATSRNFRVTPGEQAVFSVLGGLALAARVAPMAQPTEIRRRMLERRFGDDPGGRWAVQEALRNDQRMLAEAGRALGQFSSSSWIGDVDVPTTVVVTSRDRVVPPRRQRRLAEHIPMATAVEVDADHIACSQEADVFVPALSRACRRVAERHRSGLALPVRPF